MFILFFYTKKPFSVFERTVIPNPIPNTILSQFQLTFQWGVILWI